jgi:hypothetical protein
LTRCIPPPAQIGRKQLVLAYYALLGQPVDTSLVRDIEAVSDTVLLPARRVCFVLLYMLLAVLWLQF